MGRLFKYVIVLLLTVCLYAPAYAEENAPFTIAIDAGHGGKDYGCEGDDTNEKTIVLDVARRLGSMIAKEHPEVNIIYTRDKDVFVTLSERAAIANRAHADLFISIHVNSIDRRTKGRQKVHGASVYTLGLHRTDDNLAVAMRENSVIELEKDYTEVYQGFDPNSSESYIIFELTQNSHQRSSIALADAIREQLTTTAKRADKGVLQSGFLVLRATSMPSVLVELDFICNKEAERFLASDNGRELCARSIANAFTSYYNNHRHAAAQPAATAQAPDPTPTNRHNNTQAADIVTYSVQFLTSADALSTDDARLSDIDDVNYYFHDNLYKYISGSFDTLSKARKRLKQIKKRYPEAFIIKMCNGQRVN